ncbi:hypothetical protein TIFTF001_009313 [Ficus carica]|uniref:Uncharacterized protein n=1 Tax=Ficus carica TaxID=3494 RepID=A0AA88A6J8_FICCA|nr:hypothetical protein TIFTF001_009313 [Ficus carica]
MTSGEKGRDDAWTQEDDNHQRRREEITGIWVQGRQSLEEEGEENGHLGA